MLTTTNMTCCQLNCTCRCILPNSGVSHPHNLTRTHTFCSAYRGVCFSSLCTLRHALNTSPVLVSGRVIALVCDLCSTNDGNLGTIRESLVGPPKKSMFTF